jgi:hypothetical protein
MTRPEPVPILDDEGFAAEPDPALIWPDLRFTDDGEDDGLGIRRLIERAELRGFRGRRSRWRRGKRRGAN